MFYCENSSVGRAQPCQGWGREFESRLPLKIKEVRSDGGIGRHAGLKILCLYGRAGSSPASSTMPSLFSGGFLLKKLVKGLPPLTCRDSPTF